MPTNKPETDDIDWSLTTWEGSRREQLRRWAALPLERIILAIEEMQDLSDGFRQMGETGKGSARRSGQAVAPESADYVLGQPAVPVRSDDESAP